MEGPLSSLTKLYMYLMAIMFTNLMQELANLEVYPALLAWIASFLTNRKQAVRIGVSLSDWLTLKGRVPQGTKLGVILFTVMANKLLPDWQLRIKDVDDTSALEIIPRNSTSLLIIAVSDIHNFAMTHNLRLNPTKCKEMHLNFHQCPGLTLIRCTPNFDIQHKVSL